MKNIFKSSEFALAMAALAQAPLAGQPNAKDSAAYAGAQGLQTLGQGLAQQEALKKARKEAKKEKKGALGGGLGSLVGAAAMSLIPGVGPFAAAALAGAGSTAGGAIGTKLMGGSGTLGDAALKYGAPAAAGGMISAGANKLGDLVLKGTTPAMTTGQSQVQGMLENAQGQQNLAGPKYDPSGQFAASMKTGAAGTTRPSHPIRTKLGNALKRIGSDFNRLPTQPDGSFDFLE